MKIIYAASNRKGARFQLNRFYQAAKDKHQIKISAYNGGHYECNIDWLLDALYGVFDSYPNYAGVAMDIYRTQIQQYAPDLIISDCEPITTRLANDLGIRVWQVSPILLYRELSLQDKMQLALQTKYPSLFSNYVNQIKELEKSERFLIYSHLCDMNVSSKYEWVRPYAKIGEASALYEHNIIAASITNNKPLIYKLKQIDDTILFSEFKYERHPIPIKYINKQDYQHSIKNAKQVIVYGCEDLLADAFYNGKFAYMIPDFTDREIMMSIIFNEYLALGKIMYNMNDEIAIMPSIEYNQNNNVKFLDGELQ